MNKLRLAIALSDVESRKFNKILSTVIINLLNASNKELRHSSSDIQKMIFDTYGMEFSTSEIENAIDDDSSYFETYKENNIRYSSLSSKAIKKIESNANNNVFGLKECVVLFFNENYDRISLVGNYDTQSVENTINKYIYNSFNSDKEELECLISGKIKNNVKANKKRYSSNEIKLIKLFLDWDNDKKNELIFNFARAAYNYCILTIKENPEESAFSYKKLYLDTNVIFSLTGINGKERLFSTKAFIKKSKELHSKIFYTSITSEECKITLKSLIEQMACIVKKDSYLSYEELKTVFPSSNPAALFKLYSEWASGKPSRNGDYNGFYFYMIDLLNETLDDISLEAIESTFVEKNKELIENQRLSLSNHKDHLGRRHTENATRNDACNFCYIDFIRNKSTSTIKNQDIFFISSDTGLCGWAEEQSKGYINVFVSPAVMYSMMLRFSNRTKDDYKSFNDFVLLSFSNEYITEEEYKAKEDLIIAINELEMPDDAKRKVLYSANRELERITRKNNSIDEKNVRDALDAGLDNFFEEFENEKNKEKEEAVIEIGLQKYNEGFDAAIQKAAMIATKKIIKRRKIIGWGITCFLSLITTAFLILCVLTFVNEQDIKNVTGWIMASFSLVGFVSVCVTIIKNIRNRFLNIDVETLYAKELKKQKELFHKKDNVD